MYYFTKHLFDSILILAIYVFVRKNDNEESNSDDVSNQKSTTSKLQVLGTKNINKKPKLKVGIILPSSIYKQRVYNRVSLHINVNSTISRLTVYIEC